MKTPEPHTIHLTPSELGTLVGLLAFGLVGETNRTQKSNMQSVLRKAKESTLPTAPEDAMFLAFNKAMQEKLPMGTHTKPTQPD